MKPLFIIIALVISLSAIAQPTKKVIHDWGNGQVQSEGTQDTLLRKWVGKLTNWNIEGAKVKEQYFDPKGNKVGLIEWDENGLKTFEADTSKYLSWHTNGKIEYQFTDQQNLNAFYSDGSKKIEAQINSYSFTPSHNGQLGLVVFHGSWIGWHQNGTKMLEGQFIDGYKNGVWKSWDKEGNISKTQHFGPSSKNEPLQYPITLIPHILRKPLAAHFEQNEGYYENGKKRWKGMLKNGHAHGLWKFYHERADLTYEVNFYSGYPCGYFKSYSNDTTLITEGQFLDSAYYIQRIKTYDSAFAIWHPLALSHRYLGLKDGDPIKKRQDVLTKIMQTNRRPWNIGYEYQYATKSSWYRTGLWTEYYHNGEKKREETFCLDYEYRDYHNMQEKKWMQCGEIIEYDFTGKLTRTYEATKRPFPTEARKKRAAKKIRRLRKRGKIPNPWRY